MEMNDLESAIEELVLAPSKTIGSVPGQSVVSSWAISKVLAELAAMRPVVEAEAQKNMLALLEQCAGATWAAAAPSREMDTTLCIDIAKRVWESRSDDIVHREGR